jgi:hypothetical protein
MNQLQPRDQVSAGSGSGPVAVSSEHGIYFLSSQSLLNTVFIF